MWSFFVLLMTFFCTITAVPFLQSSPDIYSEAGTDSPRWLTSADFGDGMLVQNIVPHANSETDLQPAGNRLLSSELNPGWGSTSPGFPSLRSSLVDSPPPGSSYSTAQTEADTSSSCPRAALQKRFNRLREWQLTLARCENQISSSVFTCPLPNMQQGDEILLGGVSCQPETEETAAQYLSELARSSQWYENLATCQALLDQQADVIGTYIDPDCTRKLDDPSLPAQPAPAQPAPAQPAKPVQPAKPAKPAKPDDDYMPDS